MERDAISTLTHTILSGHGKEGNKIESPVREREREREARCGIDKNRSHFGS